MVEIKQLLGPELKPLSGRTPQSVVILLHGYGSNGYDLIELGSQWQGLLPDTHFIAPHAPEICKGSPFEESYQWFDLPDLNFQTLSYHLERALPCLNQLLDQVLAYYNLAENQLGLVGFSQGAMMALTAGVSRDQACAGIVSYSGAYIQPQDVKIRSLPEILLIHGDQDTVVSIDNMSSAAKALSTLGAKVSTHVCTGLSHGIDATGLSLGGDFLEKKLKRKDSRNSGIL